MQLEYTSLTARRQTLPSAVGCPVMPVSQVRRGGGGERGPGALLGTQARGLVLPGADAAGGQLIGDEPVPERAQHLPRDAAVVVTTQGSRPPLVTSARPLRRPFFRCSGCPAHIGCVRALGCLRLRLGGGGCRRCGHGCRQAISPVCPALRSSLVLAILCLQNPLRLSRTVHALG